MAEDVTSYQSPPPTKRLKTALYLGTKGLLEEGTGCTLVAGPSDKTTPPAGHTSTLKRGQKSREVELDSSLQTFDLMAKDLSTAKLGQSERFSSLGNQMPEAKCWELQTQTSAASQSPIAMSNSCFTSTDNYYCASCSPSAMCSHLVGDQLLYGKLLHVNKSAVERITPLQLSVSDRWSPLSPASDQIEATKLPNTPAAIRGSPTIRGNPSDSDTPVESPSISHGNQILAIEHRQCQELSRIHFSAPVTHIYNPLAYAAETHQCYVCCYGNSKKRILFLGMNPGPFGMAQNGVPFGDPTFARGWLKITGKVGKPEVEHPKRIIQGLTSSKSEVSGTRFWRLLQSLCGTPDVFFRNCYVHNYCPLCFMMTSGKNVTPPMLKKGERESLQEICDRSLLEVVNLLEVDWVIGVGKFAEARARVALRGYGGREVRVCSITHPSPINPAANKDWNSLATSQLAALGALDIVKGVT